MNKDNEDFICGNAQSSRGEAVRMSSLDLAAIEHTLASLTIWLETALRTTEHRGGSDQSGHPHGYAACPIPDWQVRQRLDEVKAAQKMTAALGTREAATEPGKDAARLEQAVAILSRLDKGWTVDGYSGPDDPKAIAWFEPAFIEKWRAVRAFLATHQEQRQ